MISFRPHSQPNSFRLIIKCIPQAAVTYLGYPAPPTASLYNRSFVVTSVNGPSIGNFFVGGVLLLFCGNGSLENWINFASSKKKLISKC
jgi:hypothetical protein